jgi:hypothetical protein
MYGWSTGILADSAVLDDAGVRNYAVNAIHTPAGHPPESCG